jgi:hypothetical protein
MALSAYFSDIRSQLQAELEDKIGSDHFVEEFWSDEIVDVAEEISDNYGNQVSTNPLILCTVPNSTQSARRSLPTDTEDQIEILCWIVYEDSYDENRKLERAEKAVLLTQAYLSRVKFGTSFTQQRHIDSWDKTIEFENDEWVIYSLSGNLDVEVDLQKVIDNYES